jgi:hypothetical protein
MAHLNHDIYVERRLRRQALTAREERGEPGGAAATLTCRSRLSQAPPRKAAPRAVAETARAHASGYAIAVA